MSEVVTEITIDARGAEQGSATYVRAMQAAQAAANRVVDAQNAVTAAQNKQTATMVSGAQGVGRVTAAYDKLRASLDPVAKAEIDAQSAMTKAILTTDNAVRAGVATQEQAAATIAELQEKQIAGINAVIAATEEESGAAKIAEGAMESLKGFATGLLTGLGAGVLFSEISELPSKIADALHEAAGLDHVAEAVGLTTTQLQQLDYTGALFHQTTDTMNGELERFVKNVGQAGDGSTKLSKVLGANGVKPTGDTMTDLNNFADLVQKAGSAEQRSALLTDAFGKGASELGNMFKDGSAGLKAFADQANASGAILDKSMLETAKKLDAEFTVLKLQSGTAFKEFAISIAPALLVIMMGISSVAGLIGANFGIIGKTVIIAGVALAGYFGPAAIAGLGTLFSTILDGIKAISLAMLENPLGLLIGAIAAAVAAVFLFRDQIKAAIGVDVVGDLKAAGNFIIGTFVGAFNSIKDTWKELPAAISDVLAQTEQSALDGVTYMVRQMIVELNVGISSVDGLLNKLNLPQLDRVDLPGYTKVANPNAGAAKAVGATVSGDMSAAYGTDYIGNFGSAIGGALSGPPGSSGSDGSGYGSGTNNAASAAKLSAFDKAMQSAKADTAALVAQQQALGQTAFQADYLEEQIKLLNQATSKGIALSPDQITAIDGAADAYAKQKALLSALTEVYNDGKQASEDFLSTLKSDLMSGTSLWSSLGDAASKALDDIANKALQMSADGIWDLIFGGLSGGTSGGSGGGILGTVLGFLGIGGGSASSSLGVGGNGVIGGFASGGYTGSGGMNDPAGIVHRGEYVFDAASVRRIGVSALDAMRGMPGYAMGGYVQPMPMASNANYSNDNTSVTIAPTYHFTGTSLTEAQIKRLMADNNKQLVAAVPGIVVNARRRAAPGMS